MNDQVKAYGLDEAIEAAATHGSISEIYFVACGGSYALLQEGQYVVDREAKSIASYAYSSAEFISRAPVRLGKNSLVITCSHSGNTPETVAATEYARKAGALTISLTNLADSPLDRATEKHGLLRVGSAVCHHKAQFGDAAPVGAWHPQQAGRQQQI